jgi:hypothetical protein
MKRFDPSPPDAGDAALDMAVNPFLDKLVRSDKRGRAAQLFRARPAKASWHELLGMIDTTRARPCTPSELEPWHAVTGVFVIGHDAYTTSFQTAMTLYTTEDSMFIAYGATFAVVRYKTGQPLLVT